MLHIDSNSLNAMKAHALAEYPLECCGVLLGHRQEQSRSVTQIVHCRNVHPAAATRYSIDPAELVGIQRDARDQQLEIVGFYHSHPDHPPMISETDMEEANWVGCSYVIMSVGPQQAEDIRSFFFQIQGLYTSFVEEPINISSSKGETM